MITLHRFGSGKEFILNADLIKFVEELPDTVVTLQTNEKILVQEKSREVVRKVIDYARTLRLPSDILTQPPAGG